MALSAVAAPRLAAAQDSVSTAAPGIASDALDPWQTPQRRSYIVDLARVTSSQGRLFGIAPILKTTRPAGDNTPATPLAATISPDALLAVPFASPSYSTWLAPGGGIEPARNNAALTSTLTVSPLARIDRTVVALGETGLTAGPVVHSLAIGAAIDIDPQRPERLYVTRTHAGTPTPDGFTPETGRIAIGVPAATGRLVARVENLAARAPGSFTAGPFGIFDIAADDGVVSIDLAARDASVVNLLAPGEPAPGINNATTFVQQDLGIGVSSPVAVGGLTAWLGLDNRFGRRTTTTRNDATHLAAGGAAGLAGHRGAPAVAPIVWGTNAAFTLAATATASGPAVVDRLAVWSINSGATVVFTQSAQLPATVTDAFGTTLTPGTLRHHLGTVGFVAPNAAAALGLDPQSRLLVAATATISTAGSGPSASSPLQRVVVARFPAPGQPPVWTLAAFTEPASGSPILDAAGATVGRLVSVDELTPPGAAGSSGPSISTPSVDGGGNLWLVATLRLNAGRSGRGLLRAALDPASFTYRLELIAMEGDTIAGVNSATPYRLERLALATGPITVRSLTKPSAPASDSLWAHSARPGPFTAADRATLTPGDTRALGGLVIPATIVYDTDRDGTFTDSPGSERYTAAIYLGHVRTGTLECSVADTAAPLGTLNIFDIFAYFDLFGRGDWRADLVPNGSLDVFDIFEYFNRFGAGC